MIYNPQTGEFETIAQLRRAFPNTTIPRNPNNDQLTAFGRVYVEPTEPPLGDLATQGEPLKGDDGVWRQTWNVRDYTAEELEQQRQAAIPQSITPRQARLGLLGAGLLSQVDPAIESLASPAKEQAQIEWEYATSIERDSEWINQLGTALGLDSAGIDELFKQAAEL